MHGRFDVGSVEVKGSEAWVRICEIGGEAKGILVSLVLKALQNQRGDLPDGMGH